MAAAFNGGELSSIEDLFAKGWYQKGAYEFENVAELIDALAGFRSEYTKTALRVEEQVADGDLVATRWRLTGSNGERVTVRMITLSRVSDGRIVESWRADC